MNNRLKNITYITACMLLSAPLSPLTAQKAENGAATTAEWEALYLTGKITDAGTGQPIPGARIISGKFSSLTNAEGEYNVKISSARASLIVTAPGYAAREFSAQGRESVSVNLYPAAFTPSKEKADIFARSSNMNIESALDRHFSTDVRTVQRSATEGNGSNMFIRGLNSLNVNAQPLIVVDGVIWDQVSDRQSIHAGYYINSLADIDPNDVESVRIIKNASSIYGSKGANGVILINTLRAKERPTTICFDAMIGLSETPNVIPVMDGSQYRSYFSEILRTSGMSADRMNEIGILNDDKSSLSYNKFHNNTSWADHVYRNAMTQHYGLSVRGGDDIALYGFSIGYTGGTGSVKDTDYNRLNTRFNSDVKLIESLLLRNNISFSQINHNVRNEGVNSYTSPSYIAQIKSPLYNPYQFTTVGGVLTDRIEGVDELGYSNPVAVTKNALGQNKQYRFDLSIAPEWQITDGLVLSSAFGYSIDKVREHYFTPVTGVSGQYIAGTDNYSENMVANQTIQQQSLFNESKLRFNKLVASLHNIDATVGFRGLSNKYKMDYGEGHNTGSDYVTNLLSGLAYKKVDGANDVWSSRSLFASADYTYDGRYNLWGAVAADNSSRFGTEAEDAVNMFGESWGIFPSVGAGWNISAESFMKHIGFINHLDIHAGYGLTGNDDVNTTYRLAYLQSVNYVGTAAGLKIANMRNNKLQWETTTKKDIGINLSVADNRVNASFDYYMHNTENLLTLKQAREVTGLTSYWTNSGELENKGFEASLGIKLINSRLLKWNMQISASKYENTVKALPDGNKPYTTIIGNGEILTAVGHSAGVFYGYKTDGVYATAAQAKADNLKKQNDNGSYSNFSAGDVRFVDVKKDGIIDENDKVVIGNPNPDLYGAFNNYFNFGRFNLDVIFTYSIGNDIYNYYRQTLESMTGFGNQTLAVHNRWRGEGHHTNMPKATYGDPMGNSRFSDRWIEDGSYLKLKNIRLSYDIPVKSSFIQGLNVWASASDVAVFTKYLGNDPEVSMNSSVLYQGIDYGYMPSTRSYSIGLKLNL